MEYNPSMNPSTIQQRRRYHSRALNVFIYDFSRNKRICDAIVHDLDEILDSNLHGIKKTLMFLYDYGLTHTPTAPYTLGTNNQYVTVELK